MFDALRAEWHDRVRGLMSVHELCWHNGGSGVARGGAMPPPKLLVNVFFLQRIDVVTFFESEM